MRGHADRRPRPPPNPRTERVGQRVVCWGWSNVGHVRGHPRAGAGGACL